MRRFSIIILVLFANLIITVQAQSDLAGLWEQGLLYPERFDQYVSQNRAGLQSRYNVCLAQIFDMYFPQARNELQRCRNVAGYGQEYMNCINNSPATSAVVGAQTLYQVINGQVRWVDTIYGQSALMIKQMAPMLGMNYSAWVRLFTSVARQTMRCP